MDNNSRELWCATLDKNCEPKYYIKEERARAYVERAYDKGDYLGYSAGNWEQDGDEWVMKNVGWYGKVVIEDE